MSQMKMSFLTELVIFRIETFIAYKFEYYKIRKRSKRMVSVGKDTIETYDTLVKKHEEAEKEVLEVEVELKKALERRAKTEKKSNENDLKTTIRRSCDMLVICDSENNTIVASFVYIISTLINHILCHIFLE